jgi:putative transposase
LPHLQRDAKPHFITFVTKNRWILPDCVSDIVLGSCRHDHGSKYYLHVAVVMPDHVHLILTPLIDDRRRIVVSLTEIMKAIKEASAHIINRSLSHSGPVWQEESFDRVLRCSDKLDEKISYVLENPVRASLVRSWQEYPWLWCQPVESQYSPTIT